MQAVLFHFWGIKGKIIEGLTKDKTEGCAEMSSVFPELEELGQYVI